MPHSAVALAGMASLGSLAAHAGDTPPPVAPTVRDMTYYRASGLEQKLDFYRARQPGRHPTVVYYHGGGWMIGDRKSTGWIVQRLLARGWNVASVDYRLGDVAPAPAAVQDARCALFWIVRNADELGIDVDRLITAGDSAGGHLALMAAMLPARGPFDAGCMFGLTGGDPTREATKNHRPENVTVPRASAVIDLYGIADMDDVARGPNARTYALAWLGLRSDDKDLTASISPIRYVERSSVPIVTVHGDADRIVPYAQSVRFHQALARAGVPHKLVTVAGRGHGDFAPAQWDEALGQAFDFIAALPSFARSDIGLSGRTSLLAKRPGDPLACDPPCNAPTVSSTRVPQDVH